MANSADKENNPNKGKGEGTDSKQIGPRQEYRRTGTAPNDADAMAKSEGFGKPSTPQPW